MKRKKYCPKCGYKSAYDYCPECGYCLRDISMKSKNTSSKRKLLLGIFIPTGILIIVGLILLMIIIFNPHLLSPKNEENNTSSSNQYDQDKYEKLLSTINITHYTILINNNCCISTGTNTNDLKDVFPDGIYHYNDNVFSLAESGNSIAFAIQTKDEYGDKLDDKDAYISMIVSNDPNAVDFHGISAGDSVEDIPSFFEILDSPVNGETVYSVRYNDNIPVSRDKSINTYPISCEISYFVSDGIINRIMISQSLYDFYCNEHRMEYLDESPDMENYKNVTDWFDDYCDWEEKKYNEWLNSEWYSGNAIAENDQYNNALKYLD